jgi:hypothetical protein
MAYRWRWILALLVILLLPVSIMRVHAADHGKPVHHTAGDKGDHQKGGEDKDDADDDDADDDEDGDDDEDCDGDDGDDDDADEDEDDADEDEDICDGDDEDDDDADEDDDAEEIDVADLPKAVVDAVNVALPGATIEEAERETDDGVVIYEVVVEHEGTSYELRIDDKGTLLSKKEEDADDEEDDDD